LTGRLPEAELERIAAHLQVCADCLADLPTRLPEDPLVAALQRPLQAEPCAEEPECVSTVELLASQGPSTVSVPGTGETASYPRLGSDVTPHASARPVQPAFDKLPCAFGRYRILQRLGQGGMGAVFLAEDTLLQRRVALKVSRFDDDADVDAEERFRREARAAAALLHEGICPVFDYGVEAGVPFITMAYIEGKSLYQVLKENKQLEPRQAAELVRQAALALAEAHRHGVLHRDLKPANILIDGRGRPQVVDFGLAKRAEDVTLTRPGATAGTPAYMSPEQIKGEPLGAATDIYSLGVILYQLVAGRLPFPGSTMTELSYQIVHQEPAPPSARRIGLDARLDAICKKALAKSPAERYANMSDLAADLQEVLKGAPATPPLAPPIGRFRWGHGVVAAALLLAAGLTYYLWPREPHEPEPKPVVLAGGSTQRASTTRPEKSTPTAKDMTAKDGSMTPGQAELPALSAALDVKVWQPGNRERQGLGLRDGGLPLQPDDWVAMEAILARPSYAYIVWISANGKVDPVYPWTPGRWKERPAVERPMTSLRLPSNDWSVKWPMSANSPAGMETLVLLARPTQLGRDVDLESLLGGLGEQARQNTSAAVWFENFEPVIIGRLRAPNFFDVKRLDDPVLRTQRELRDRLSRYFTYSAAVSFANMGGKKHSE
jgi:serine/threonine protein kinase